MGGRAGSIPATALDHPMDSMTINYVLPGGKAMTWEQIRLLVEYVGEIKAKVEQV